ncbi:dihydrolipoyl dehydrogenase family protein [Lentilactobacillus sp. SPB1-3]|uniref:NAD(P)/FAD-dependent oxidoreductase n=1 Tax=Lentilactobacillus terminaliae TaxID=3003483 RepID=A0ACD5DGP7_9LACO|nr:NAD(P)/FAD-dependent oxidoreductase [Lentilactobacillus sp. SPB1-3]MCZ0977044.1 NAD(P)/FAD-dependent oxidoreductase [Lentilactobacillus sp. SPB1-3]
MKTKFDVIVIGSGVAGMTVALNLAQHHKQVAVVESRSHLGGTTINSGSTGKKSLLAVAEAHYQARLFQNYGLAKIPAIDWDTIGLNRDEIVSSGAIHVRQELLNNDVTIISGTASFVDKNSVKVNEMLYTADTFVIASGSKPRLLSVPGKEYVQTSNELLNLPILPNQTVLIGAGIIGFALASLLCEAGVKVSIIQHNNRALREFDENLVNKLINHLQNEGVEFYFDSELTNVSKTTNGLHVQFTHQQTIEADSVFVVAGRIANVDNLKLASIGVDTSTTGIKVNDQLQTSVPNIYALGDCCDAPVPKLSNYATFQAKYLGNMICSSDTYPIKYPVPAMTVFSLPKLGLVGISGSIARNQPEKYEVKLIDMHQWQSYRRKRQPIADLELIIRRSDDHVVGAEVLSDDADLLVNYMAILINLNVTSSKLNEMMFAYPSMADDIFGFWQ